MQTRQEPPRPSRSWEPSLIMSSPAPSHGGAASFAGAKVNLPNGALRRGDTSFVEGSPLDRENTTCSEQPPFARESSTPLATGGVPGNHLDKAKYCGFHCAGKRMKGPAQMRECQSCHTMITTNYTDFSFCPDCSQSQCRCLICGLTAKDNTPMPMHGTGMSVSVAGGGQVEPRFFVTSPAGRSPKASAAPSMSLAGVSPGSPTAASPNTSPVSKMKKLGFTSPSQLEPQVPPKFCCKHDDSIKRVKAVPRDIQCQECGRDVVSNYQEFTLCAWCSDKTERCMLCGTNASNEKTPFATLGGAVLVARRLH